MDKKAILLRATIALSVVSCLALLSIYLYYDHDGEAYWAAHLRWMEHVDKDEAHLEKAKEHFSAATAGGYEELQRWKAEFKFSKDLADETEKHARECWAISEPMMILWWSVPLGIWALWFICNWVIFGKSAFKKKPAPAPAAAVDQTFNSDV